MLCRKLLFIVGICCVTNLCLRPANGELVGYWNFDGNVEDQSGSGNDGELVDAVYSDDVPGAIGSGQSLSFEVDTDHVFVENADGTLDSETFTISMFVFDRGQVGALERLTSREGDTFETAINVHPPFNGMGEYAYYSGAGGGWQWGEEVAALEEWQHVAYVADADEEYLNIYVDGELVWETLDPWTTFPVGFMHIGNRHNDVEGFDGMLDDVAMWDEVLSEADIKAIAEGGVACFLSGGPCGGLLGDYNGNGAIDAGDLDVQAEYMKDNNLAGDLNGDGKTDSADRLAWITDIQMSWTGDSNFDNEFNSSDFVLVFGAAKYEKDEMATYAEGDWNGDMLFNSSDFVAAFTHGGYELGPPAAAVPEPSSIVLISLGVFGLLRQRRN